MAAALPLQTKTEINPLLVCTLCKGELKTPRLLPCQHSFCTQCLREKLAILQKGEQLKCPSCKRVVHLKKASVKSLPENFLFHIMRESMGFGKGDLECFSCQTVSKKTSSSHVCLDCGDPLCTTCKEWHCRTSGSTHHLVVSFDAMKERKFQDEWVRRKQKKCEKHNLPLTLYCKDCECLVCNDCFVKEHRHHICENWNETSKKHRPIMKGKIEEISKTHEVHIQRVSKAREALVEMQKEQEKKKNRIYNQATEIHDLVDKIKEVKLGELDGHYEKEIQERHQILERESKQENYIDRTETFANNFLNHSSDVDFLQHEKEVEGMLPNFKHMERKSYSLKCLTTKRDGIYTLADGIRRVYGEITVRNETILQDRQVGEVRELFKYEVKARRLVTGLAVDDDGNVLVACKDLPKILVLTSEGKHKGWIGCEQLNNAMDIFVKGDNIYLTDRAPNERKVIVMDNKGKVKKIIKLPETEQKYNNAVSLTVNDEGTVFVSSYDSDTIYISHPSNDSFIPYITKQDQSDMNGPFYLHITTRNDLVYHKLRQKVVEAYDDNKELQWKYEGQDAKKISYPSGICGDQAGNVYIADFHTSRIHVVSNGKPVGCIKIGKDDKKIRPLAITKHDELIYAYDNNVVKIAFWE